MAEPEPSLLDIKQLIDSMSIGLNNTVSIDDIKVLATRKDLSELDARIDAQGQEILQLRGELKLLQNNIASVQTTVDSQIASGLGNGAESTGRDPGSR